MTQLDAIHSWNQRLHFVAKDVQLWHCLPHCLLTPLKFLSCMLIQQKVSTVVGFYIAPQMAIVLVVLPHIFFFPVSFIPSPFNLPISVSFISPYVYTLVCLPQKFFSFPQVPCSIPNLSCYINYSVYIKGISTSSHTQEKSQFIQDRFFSISIHLPANFMSLFLKYFIV